MNQVDSWQGSTILAAAQDDVVGKTLNNTYSVERIVGEGAMGRIYLARHTRIAQKYVAVKVLRIEHLRNADVLARFQREAETAASICHPNVVAVYDVDRTSRGLSYLVTEYLEGLDLGQYLKQRNRLSLSTTVHIARQLCEGLGAAHQRGVIHRDLKPSNIFLVGDFAAGVPKLPFIKILDFGLSKFMDAPAGELVTATDMVMGTPAFMPPEQAQAQQADIRADIYGVGALMYVCLTGRPPFDEDTPQATVLAVVRTEPLRPRALVPSIPEYAESVIQRAMAKSPAARYPDMAALLTALEPLVEDRHIRHEVRSALRKPQGLNTRAEWVTSARPKLVLFLGLALALLLASAAVGLAGIEEGLGWSLTRMELILLLAFGVAASITPAVLLVHRIRRHVWGNTNRVLDHLSKVRVAVIAVVATYGLAWLGSRVLDGVVFRLMRKPSQVNLPWPGWDFLLPLIAVGAGIVALLRERTLSRRLSHRAHALVVVLASAITLALAAVVVPVGLHRQAKQAAARARAAKAPPRADLSDSQQETVRSPSPAPGASSALALQTTQTSPPAPSASLASSAAAESAKPTEALQPAQLATKQELREAAGQGEKGWLPLAERYPTDARVLRALVLARASHSGGLGDAMLVLSRLFKVDPEEAKSADMQFLVQRAAETPGQPAEAAWKMLEEEMGTHGPDVLYRLTFSRPKLAERAGQLLDSASVRPHISPALAAAYELKSAPTCAARLPMIDHAIEVGDERALAMLARLSAGTSRGCGKYKRKPCSPACPEQAAQFRAAVAQLSLRLRHRDK